MKFINRYDIGIPHLDHGPVRESALVTISSMRTLSDVQSVNSGTERNPKQIPMEVLRNAQSTKFPCKIQPDRRLR